MDFCGYAPGFVLQAAFVAVQVFKGMGNGNVTAPASLRQRQRGACGSATVAACCLLPGPCWGRAVIAHHDR